MLKQLLYFGSIVLTSTIIVVLANIFQMKSLNEAVSAKIQKGETNIELFIDKDFTNITSYKIQDKEFFSKPQGMTVRAIYAQSETKEVALNEDKKDKLLQKEATMVMFNNNSDKKLLYIEKGLE